MGQWRNEHSRVWNPWGSWVLGEELEEAAHRKAADRREEVSRSPTIRFYKNRCLCCRRRYAPSRIQGVLCERCRPHSVCQSCGRSWPDDQPTRTGICLPCSESIRRHYRNLETYPPEKQPQIHSNWVEDQKAERLPVPSCPIFNSKWFDEFLECIRRFSDD